MIQGDFQLRSFFSHHSFFFLLDFILMKQLNNSVHIIRWFYCKRIKWLKRLRLQKNKLFGNKNEMWESSSIHLKKIPVKLYINCIRLPQRKECFSRISFIFIMQAPPEAIKCELTVDFHISSLLPSGVGIKCNILSKCNRNYM